MYDIWNENTKLINIENIYISISSFRERTYIAILQLRRGVVNHQFYYLRFKQLSKRHTKRLNNNKPANQHKKKIRTLLSISYWTLILAFLLRQLMSVRLGWHLYSYMYICMYPSHLRF